MDWANDLPADEGPELRAIMLASPYAGDGGLELAIELASEHPDSLAIADALAVSFRETTTYMPAKAIDLAHRLPDGTAAKRGIVSAIVEAYSKFDPYSASEWLSRQLPENWDDQAVIHLLDSIPDDPHGAMSWLTQIRNSETRLQALQRVAASWAARDPEDFFANWQHYSFAAEEREILRQVAESRGDFP